MLGSYVSAGYVTQPEEAARRFFDGLLELGGVRRPVAVTGDPVEVRLLQSGREHLAFVFDHAATPATTAVTLRVPLDGRTVFDLGSGEAAAVAPAPAASSGAARSPRATSACCASARAQSSGFVFRLRNSIRQPSASRPKWPRDTPIGISLVNAPLTQTESARPRATTS